jgi:hypothetical protein
MVREGAREVPGEVRRSAFAISDRHVITAWHCIREAAEDREALWFRLRRDALDGRQYCYIPLRVTNYDDAFDIAALAVDSRRLAGADLSAEASHALLAEAAIPLGEAISVGDQTQIVGFPSSATGADSDTNIAEVVDTALPLGNVTGLKLYCSALAAVDPVDPHGLSGGPVITNVAGPTGHGRYAVAAIRAAPRGTLSGAASGGGLVATLFQDVAARIPEVAVALSRAQAARATTPTPMIRPVNVLSVSRACARALRDTMVEFKDPSLGTLTGWSHFLHESLTGQRPTAIGTAYGLKTVLLLGDHDGRVDRAALAETLWRLRLPDNGWAARTGSGISRPEVTALVLGALATSGFDPVRLGAAAAAFEQSLSPDFDDVGMTRTYVISAVIRGLVAARPESARLKVLRGLLLAGAMQDPEHEDLTCWPATWMARRDQILVPSVAHTAMAIVALARANSVLAEDTPSRTALSQAVRWLSRSGGLEHQTEQIRRPVTEYHWDSLTLRHFTEGWVTRALLAAPDTDDPAIAKMLQDAVRRVWLSQRGGLWEWDDHDRPIWMTYQGASAVREYAMHVWAPE